MKKIWDRFVNILTFIGKHFKALIFLLILFLLFAPSSTPTQTPNLMRIDLTGVITDSSKILKEIKTAKTSENIKGILFYVDSPGGSVAPSVEIYMAINDLKKSKKVVAYAAGTMASGSYYAASPSDTIVANPGSMIGSIGVIASIPNIEELTKKIGISEQVISAGEYKQAGTVMRKMNEKERAALQENVDDIYELFVNDVANARGLDIAKKDEFANARVFIASKAKDVGLVDKIGSINDANELLVEMAGVKEAIWKEPDFMDKLEKKFGQVISSQLLTLFYGVKYF
ncbi:MAG: signal peptide peptidase SppA [Campylobacteraceae bacterium]|jgi:protease-4|nr:signal peptide peptidase SppA [Campylobacteraceae bacterium]